MTTDIAAILRHRDELKRRDPEVICLFRVEDRYRAFGEDARLLRDTISNSMKSMECRHYGQSRDSASIPITDLDAVLARIAAAGKRVELVERVIEEEASMIGKVTVKVVPRSNADVIADARTMIAHMGGNEPYRVHPLDVDLIRELTDRLEAAEKLNTIEEAIRDYYLALDNREHGGVASWKALDRIQVILGMSWRQGDEKRRREAMLG